MNPWVVHFYFPIFGTLFIPIDTLLPMKSTPVSSVMRLVIISTRFVRRRKIFPQCGFTCFCSHLRIR